MKQKLAQYFAAVLMGLALVSFVGCQSTPTQRSTAETAEDAAITAKVKTAFAADPLVKAYQINVDTYRNDVTLTGNVDSQATIYKAVEVARGVSGVKGVKSNLVVK